MNGEILRIVESIHKDKNIDREIVFNGIESALTSAAKKYFGTEANPYIRIDRQTGDIIIEPNGEHDIDPATLGRIAAQTAKQVIIQKIREAERNAIYDEYKSRLFTIINGSVSRFEGPHIIVNLNRTEGILKKEEQIRGEVFRNGERVKALIIDAKKVGQNPKIVLSRTHPEFVRRLFEIEVPEITEGIIVIKGIAREAGSRTKIAVDSNDKKIDAVGACVGVRGTRIKNIIDELNGEKIDIVRWSDDPETFLLNCLKPAEIESIKLEYKRKQAKVVVKSEQLSLAIGKKGQNVRLASKLSGWDIDIFSLKEVKQEREELLAIPITELSLPEEVVARLMENNITTIGDVVNAGAEALAQLEGMDPESANVVWRKVKEIIPD